MSSNTTLSYALAAGIALAGSLTAAAQTVRTINFTDVQNQTIDQLIAADIAGLARNDSAAHLIYELQPGFPFFMDGELEWEDAHVELRPQAVAGERPLLIQRIGSGGATVDQLFRLQGIARLTLRGLLVTGRTNQLTYNDRIVRTSGENTVTFDDVVVDEIGQAVFRINGGSEKIYLYNSSFNRLGRTNNPDNGRLFDNRSDGADSIVMRNCLITNTTSRWYRSSASEPTKYLAFERNTFVGAGQHGFDVTEGAEEFVFTDNIVADAIFLGRDKDDSFDSTGVRLPDARYVVMIDSTAGARATITNNNFFQRPSSVTALPRVEAGGDSLVTVQGFYFSPYVQRLIGATDGAGAGTSNLSEVLDFTNGPAAYTQFIVANASDTTSGNEIPSALPWDNAGLTPFANYSDRNLGSGEPLDRYTELYNLCYPAGTASASAGSDGASIGGQVASCPGLSTSIRELSYGLPARAYPNPTPGLLTVELDEAAAFSVEVYDAIGRRVLTQRESGVRAEVDLSAQPAGMYRVRVVDQDARASVLTVVRQ